MENMPNIFVFMYKLLIKQERNQMLPTVISNPPIIPQNNPIHSATHMVYNINNINNRQPYYLVSLFIIREKKHFIIMSTKKSNNPQWHNYSWTESEHTINNCFNLVSMNDINSLPLLLNNNSWKQIYLQPWTYIDIAYEITF